MYALIDVTYLLDAAWNNTGRDDSCGLRFVTIKVGPIRGGATHSARSESFSHRDLTNKSHAALSGTGSHFKPATRKRLRYCYECGRSIGNLLSVMFLHKYPYGLKMLKRRPVLKLDILKL